MLKNVNTLPKLLIGFSIPMALMAIMAAVVYVNIGKLQNNSKWVEHTYEVIVRANTLSKLLVDMETGQRGFIIAGKQEYLEPYDAGLKGWETSFLELRGLVSDNSDQVSRLDAIDTMKKEWIINAGEKEIALRRKVSQGEEIQQVSKNIQSRTVGKDIFDSIRLSISDINENFILDGGGETLNEGHEVLLKITLDLVNMETGQRGFLLTGKDESLEPYLNGEVSLDANLLHLKELILSSSRVSSTDLNELKDRIEAWKEKAALPEINARKEVNKYPDTMSDVVKLIEKGTGKQYMDALRAELDVFIGLEASLMDQRKMDSIAAGKTTVAVTLLGTLIAVIVSLVIAILVARQISHSIQQVSIGLKELGKGNFSFRFEHLSQDDVGQMMVEINETCKTLGDVIRVVQGVSESVASTSSQITVKNDDLAEKTQIQAGNVERTSVSLSKIAETVSSNSMNSQEMHGLSSESSSKANAGSKVVSDTVEAVKSIADSSEEIVDIINVIDEIAFQTNLLALNAAVEAARAGEHGRGFAVVASEVRNLAQRTTSSAKEIKDLIENSMRKVENGSMMVEKTGATFSEIISGINKVTEIASTVSNSSVDQKGEINDVNKSLLEIDHAIQNNTTLVEEMSAACHGLKAQAEELQNRVSEFTV